MIAIRGLMSRLVIHFLLVVREILEFITLYIYIYSGLLIMRLSLFRSQKEEMRL